MKGPILLTEAEAAEALRLSPRTLRKARQDGLLRYVLIGRAVRYTMADLESFVETLRQVQNPCLNHAQRKTGSASQGQRKRSAVVVPFHKRKAGARQRDGL